MSLRFISEIILTRVLDKNYKNLFGQLSYNKVKKKKKKKKKAFSGINSLYSVLQGGYENILGPWKKVALGSASPRPIQLFFMDPIYFRIPPVKHCITNNIWYQVAQVDVISATCRWCK